MLAAYGSINPRNRFVRDTDKESFLKLALQKSESKTANSHNFPQRPYRMLPFFEVSDISP